MPEELKLQIENNKIFAPLKNKWLVLKPEEEVRQYFICRLVNQYGYALEQMDQEVKVSNSQRGQGKARADIVIWKSAEDKKAKKGAFIVVECKAQNVKVQKEDFYQGLNYATWAKAKFLIATNEKETRFFKIIEDVIPDEIDEIADIPKAADANNEKELKRILEQTKTFSRDEFQKLLFACHNVIRNNDKLSPEMAFDEISKVLFMKIRSEREKGAGIFSKAEFEKLKEYDTKTRGKDAQPPFYQYLFDQTKKAFEKDEIFDDSDTIRIRETSFLQIVKLLERYNLSATSDDVKGIAFEEFLGKTFRGDLGQFFTPRTIVDFIVGVLDPREGEIICDPCCGTGGFLIKAFEYIRSQIEQDIQQHKERLRKELEGDNFKDLPEEEQERINNEINNVFAQLNMQLDSSKEGTRLRNLSYRCIFGTDAEPRSARTAKMNMIMHGDGHGGVHHHDGLIDVNGIFENRFDVIFSNPPFGARISRELKIEEADIQKDKDKRKYYEDMYEGYKEVILRKEQSLNKPLLSLYDLGTNSTLSEVLFIERYLRLLKPGGRMGIVLPEGVLNNSDLQRIREYAEGKAKLILIVSLPQDVFIKAGATVKPSLVFLKKFTAEEREQYDSLVQKATEEVNLRHKPTVDAEEQALQQTEEKLAAAKQALEEQKKEWKKNKTPLSEQQTQMLTLKQEIGTATTALSVAKKDYARNIAAIDALKAKEIKAIVKVGFDYTIPVAQVEKAGISSTGAKTTNELEGVLQEYTPYRKEHQLWQEFQNFSFYSYQKGELTQVLRVGEKQESFT